MVQDEPAIQDRSESRRESRAESRDRSAGGRVALFCGVAGACALGAGLGLWARPSDAERPGFVKPAPAVTLTSSDRRLPIVVDDSPAPIGQPMDVLTPSTPRPAVIPRRVQAADPELRAPTRPPNGLVRVTAPAPGPMPTMISRPPPPAPDRAAQARLIQAQADAAKQHAVKLAAAKAEKLRHRTELAAQTLAKAEARAEAIAEARADAKAERLAKLETRHERMLEARAKAYDAHMAQLARAAPPPSRARHGLAILAHALARLAPHHSAPPDERAEAQPERRHKPTARELARAAPRPRAPATQPLMARGGGTIRVASVTTRCASPDPGEALACGDPNLGAAERRLTRAYRDAEAAGVPASTLQQQQQRWKAARAAAAREAPWAVKEVYQARIAELQDLTRDAQGN